MGTLKHELDDLKRDREVIVKEVISLRQQQAAHRQETAQLTSRLDHSERLHQQLLKALTSAVQDPAIQQALAARPSLQITASEQQQQQQQPGVWCVLVACRSAIDTCADGLLIVQAPSAGVVRCPASWCPSAALPATW